MARNCPSCGRANDDDARFCSGCGAEIASAEPVPAAAPSAQASPAGPVSPAPPAAAQGTVQKVRIAKPALVAIDSMAWLGPQSLLVAGFTMTPKSQGEDAELLVYDPVAGIAEPLKDDAGVALRGVSVSASADGGKVAYVTYTA